MHPLVAFGLSSLAFVLALAAVFHVAARLGSTGRAFCDWCAKAPALDVVVFLFTHGPWVGAFVASRYWPVEHDIPGGFWPWLGAALVAQGVALVVWSRAHELMHRRHSKGPRIVSTLNRRVGAVRNHLAVWWTALAVPVFTMVRLAEIIVYPLETWLIRLPKYKSSEWINVSRQKFEGLVGYDLIWCLYCDWMTGVWSLGTEMLRNIETFWCPIRFSSPEKCENCKIDFPDVVDKWVKPTPEGSMSDVVRALEKHYPGPGGVNAWWGHKVRLTVKGKEVGEG